VAGTRLSRCPFPLDLNGARTKIVLETIISEQLFFLKFLIYCVKEFAQLGTSDAEGLCR